jgi:uncharacterized protein YdeI (YjbR/CyaY-like superfamily)
MPAPLKFFKTPAAFRGWLEKNHATVDELWVGYYKVATGKPSVTWQETVDEALCFGWIDGLRKTIDEESYKIRFTPRRKGSVWSAKNVASAEQLIAAGRMRPPGVREFEKRTEDKSSIYSYEQREKLTLSPEYEKHFKKNKAAWKYYRAQAPGYRSKTAHWVMAAKKEETRLRRLGQLIEHSAEQSAIPPLARPKDR